ncbi:MAG: dipeptide/oligopeptide/nickel ABC transporter ATP-binding protein [Oscillospiraceae bacterium]|nr:dipeptide/oligopeptide/nickel ABC transporter ATP-binding protein [Oscillospiraceae bacterium]
MLEARNISKIFPGRSRTDKVIALDCVSIRVESGKTLALMGPSGCGKSTLARILLRLIPPDSGEVFYGGEEITHHRGRRLRRFRNQVQFISQHPESFFDPSIRLGYSVLEPLKFFGLYNEANSCERLRGFLKQVKLSTSLLERYPHQVSGGEIQRLAICRALLLRPRFLILDEVTSMLDISVQAQILHILKELQLTQKLGYLVITHDREVAKWMTDNIVEMQAGKVITQLTT